MNVFKEFQKANAIYENGHFVYYSGKHGPKYINTDRIFPNTILMREITSLLTEPFIGGFEVVTGPPTGGIVLATYAAAAISTRMPTARLLWPDKSNAEFLFLRDGFAQGLKGKKVLVTEDIVTTGSSAAKVCREVEKHGGIIVAISAICNRGGVTSQSVGWPFQSLISVGFQDYEPAYCPLCKDQVPIVLDIGHGDEFQVKHLEYNGGFINYTNYAEVAG